MQCMNSNLKYFLSTRDKPRWSSFFLDCVEDVDAEKRVGCGCGWKMCDNELQAIFHFNEKRNGWEGYHRLTDRERIFNFNSAINSSATRCAKSWKKASSHLPRLVVRDGNSDMRLPQPRRETLSENYLRLRELISLAVEWATTCMWNIFSFLAFLITRFRLIPTSARGAQAKVFYETRASRKSV